MTVGPDSPVITGTGTVFPAAGGTRKLGPYTIYQLSIGETSMIEAVTFDMAANTLTANLQAVLELRDPSSNILYAYPSAIFNYD